MEIILIQVVVFTVASKQKNKKWKQGLSRHLPTMKKSALLKTRESHFSLVWVMECSIVSSCLGKDKVFPIILACQS